MNESILMKGLLAIAVLIALFPTAFGITLLMGQGDPGSATERIAAGTILMLVGLLLVAGLVISRSRPRLGLGLVTAPVIFTCAWLYWVAVIIAPIGLCLAAFAYFRGRQSGGTNMNGGAPAATA